MAIGVTRGQDHKRRELYKPLVVEVDVVELFADGPASGQFIPTPQVVPGQDFVHTDISQITFKSEPIVDRVGH